MNTTGAAIGTGSPSAVWHIGRALLPSGWASNVRVRLGAGRIVSVDADQPRMPGDVTIPVGLPGMSNLHSHAFQRAMSGLTEVRGPADDSFWSWRSLMYRFVHRLSPDMVEAIAALAYIEMLESGFTRVGEFHYLHHDVDGRAYADPAEMGGRIGAAAAATGIGLTLLPVFYAHSAFGGCPANAEQQRFLSTPDSYLKLVAASRAAVAGNDQAIVGLAPHSLRAATPEELAAILANRGDLPVHIHVAEQIAEVEACLAWSGARPVEWLLANLPVDERWCLVHATHVTGSELDGIARRGAVVGLCPTTEANLGDGVFPAETFIKLGGGYGIGSDSNVRIDMSEELRLLEYGQRLVTRSRNVMAGSTGRSTGRTMYEAAVSGGAQALGVTGGLVAGASADLLVIDPEHPLLAGRSDDSLIDTLVFGGARTVVTEVWCAGKIQVMAGRHHKREGVERAYKASAHALLDL